MDDNSKMPFGKYKGTRLGDMPDWYWKWFLDQEWCDKWPDLAEYARLTEEDDENGEPDPF